MWQWLGYGHTVVCICTYAYAVARRNSASVPFRLSGVVESLLQIDIRIYAWSGSTSAMTRSTYTHCCSNIIRYLNKVIHFDDRSVPA